MKKDAVDTVIDLEKKNVKISDIDMKVFADAISLGLLDKLKRLKLEDTAISAQGIRHFASAV